MPEINIEQLKKEIKEELIKSEILMSIEDGDGFSISKIYSFFKKNWKIIVFIPLIVGIISAIYSLYLPDYYKSSASIYIFSNGKSSALNVFFNSFSEDSYNDPGNASLLFSSLKSDSMYDYIINKFGIATNPAIIGEKSVTKEDLIYDKVLKDLKEIIKINYEPNNRIITITAETMIATTSAEIVNEYLNKLDQFTKGPRKEKLEFVKIQLDKTSKELEESENKLKSFQNQHRLLSIDKRYTETINKLTSLEIKKNEAEITLEQLKSFLLNSKDTKSDLSEIKNQCDAETAKLNSINLKITELNKEIENMPDNMLELAKLKRAISVKEKIYSVLNEQYEIAKIAEAEESYQFKIIDRPRIAIIKSRPSRTKICLNALLISFFFSLGISLFKEFSKN